MKASFWHKTLRILAAGALWAGFGHALPAAQAAQSGWESADYAQVRLLAGNRAADSTQQAAGLEVRLAPGWHAYWRMPGDGGLPPTLDWSASENVADVETGWPVPERFVTAGLHSFGYKDHFILPLTVTLEAADAPADMRLSLALMVCEEICVPQNFELSLPIPAEGVDGSMHEARLAAIDLPFRGDTDNLSISNMVVGPEALVATIRAARGFGRLDVFVEAGDLYVTAPPEIAVSPDDPQTAQVRIAAPEHVDDLLAAIGDHDVILTVTDGQEAIERRFDF